MQSYKPYIKVLSILALTQLFVHCGAQNSEEISEIMAGSADVYGADKLGRLGDAYFRCLKQSGFQVFIAAYNPEVSGGDIQSVTSNLVTARNAGLIPSIYHAFNSVQGLNSRWRETHPLSQP